MESAGDPFELARFVRAQQVNYQDALAEITAGLKRSHWSWYIFPQVAGLGSSAMSVRYAITGLPEAKAYLAHPVLGSRLRECVGAMNARSTASAASILGDVDALKFHSCLTLFSLVAEPGSPFHQALAKYFAGAPDPATSAILSRHPSQRP